MSKMTAVITLSSGNRLKFFDEKGKSLARWTRFIAQARLQLLSQ
jgi:hypothetical protein